LKIDIWDGKHVILVEGLDKKREDIPDFTVTPYRVGANVRIANE
jgi:hypothetical protein